MTLFALGYNHLFFQPLTCDARIPVFNILISGIIITITGLGCTDSANL